MIKLIGATKGVAYLPGTRFPLFPDFPKELRDFIWELAIQNRNAEPLAHIFTISPDASHTALTNAMPDPYGIGEERFPFRNSGPWYEWETRVQVPVEVPGSTVGSKEMEQNPSGYLLDSGLWSACQESRWVITRTWEKHGPKHFRYPYEIAQTAVTVSFRTGSRTRNITIHPLYDLIILQVPFQELSFDTLITSHMLRLAHMGCYGTVFDRICFPYDPAWGKCMRYDSRMRVSWNSVTLRDGGYGGSLCRFASEILNVAGDSLKTPMVWLLDTSGIQPVDNISYTSLVEDREVFIAQGRRYIEVWECDLGTRWRLSEEHNRPFDTPFPFIEDFDRYCLVKYKEWAREFIPHDCDLELRVACLQDGLF